MNQNQMPNPQDRPVQRRNPQVRAVQNRNTQVRTTVFTAIAAVVSIFVIFLLIFLVAGTNSAAKKSADLTSQSAEQQNAAQTADNTAAQAGNDNNNAQQTETISTDSDTDVGNTTASYSGTLLFIVDEDTSYYLVSSQSNEVSFDYPDGTISGFYTGTYSTRYPDYIAIFYLDTVAYISSSNAVAVNGANILRAAVYPQVIESQYIGYSGCGVACFYMMQQALGLTAINGMTTYDALLEYAETNSYGDQGSLYTLNGGMSYDSMARFAQEVYGKNLVNGYDSTKNPSDIIKDLIDQGKQAIVLVKYDHGNVVDFGSTGHFILVTGYIQNGSNLQFIYANSYYETGLSHGNPLDHIDSSTLDAAVSSDFSEPNAIMYFE